MRTHWFRNRKLLRKSVIWVKNRSKESSTHIGIIGLIAGVAALFYLFIVRDPMGATESIACGIAAMGMYEIIKKEKPDDESA